MTPARPLTLGMILTATAGFLDAIGFVALGGYYISFMSGNTTQLGAALPAGELGVVVLSASLVVLFFIGSALGTLVVLANPRWGAARVSAIIAAGVTVALGLSLIGLSIPRTMLILALTAGAQNAVLPAHGAVRLGATFVTGTLYAAGQDFALALRRLAPPFRWLQHLGVWLSLMGGAALGAFVYRHAGIGALLIPLIIYTAFAAANGWIASQTK
ncbi:DUF1275 domain-containing protein [Devosia sp. PTR5]|uniref:DUF1275 domain-containing protein n=1 Tax=Devosia oryzisoli TaxID=2774138 RepID=A0A927FU47_9HYPH|nr:YoaK family protein [Devosia oryzisoli]MBD8064704.1 DUF1275 domain-containing protein [Devosia oryzisoli]